MSEQVNKALLPIGLRDVLPPDAEQEAYAVDAMLGVFSAHGYQRVKPPLIEFEDSLLDGAGAATAKETFRVMDPVSQRMMGVRADMTTQVARIATSRLVRQPRPLRLCYAGQVLRVKGNQLRPERQFTQAGLELIGAETPLADAEVVSLVVRALDQLGVRGVTVDLTLPTLVPALCEALDVAPATQKKLRAALDQKDAAMVKALGGEVAAVFGDLLTCSGDADDVLQRLQRLALPRVAEERWKALAVMIALVRENLSATATPVALTVDPVESRGFEYHTGISFSVFAHGVRGELGRGGRYRTGQSERSATLLAAEKASGGLASPNGERAVGASLFVDAVSEGMAARSPVRRLLLSPVDRLQAATYQQQGWVTVAALNETLQSEQDLAAEARRLGCCHYSVGGQVRPATEQQG